MLLQAGAEEHDEAMKTYAATFLLTTEQANKLHLGKSKRLTALYGARTPRAARRCARRATARRITPA